METAGPQVLTLVVRALRWAIEPSHSVESLTACEYGFGISPPSPTREFHSLGKAIAILNRMSLSVSLILTDVVNHTMNIADSRIIKI